MELREAVKSAIWDSGCWGGAHEARLDAVADAILALPEIDLTPTRMRVLAALGALRDDMTPEQVKTIQQFADKLP